MHLNVYVPKLAALPAIQPGAGIIGSPSADHPGKLLVDYEDNRAGAINIQTYADRVTIGGARLQNQYFVVVCGAAVSFTALAWFFGRTYLGKALTACSSNPYAARLFGIDPTRMGLLAFGLGGVLGGLAGVLIAPLQPISFDSDVTLATNGFAAAIFGGLMRPGLALAGGLVLGVSESMVAGYLKASYQTMVALPVMLGLMIWQASRRPVGQEEL
jgi:branched-chain amino acid transport system permease protein